MEQVVRRGAVGFGRIIADDPDAVVVRADRVWRYVDPEGRTVICYSHHNAFVRSGLRNAELLQAGLSGGRVAAFIGLDNDNSAVTFNTRFLHGASAGGATNTTPTSTQMIVAATAAIVADGSGVVQTTTYTGPTLTAASFTAGVFVVYKYGLMLAGADADGNLVDVIGGASGTAPYDRAFQVGLVGSTGFSFTPSIQTYSIADPTQ